MCSKNELLNDYRLPKEDQLIPKSEPIDEDFIQTEGFEEEGCFVQETVEFDKDSTKQEIIENEDNEKFSPSNVRTHLFNICNLLLIPK